MKNKILETECLCNLQPGYAALPLIFRLCLEYPPQKTT